MIRISLQTFMAFMFLLNTLCSAQQLRPVFELSAAESAEARRNFDAVKKAQDRSSSGRLAWKAWVETYQAAHPELPGLQITSDFRRAYVARSLPMPDRQILASAELSAADQSKARSTYTEMFESAVALQRAYDAWQGFQHQLLADHVAANGSGSLVTFKNGKQFVIPSPWSISGIGFTDNFRFAVPLSN